MSFHRQVNRNTSVNPTEAKSRAHQRSRDMLTLNNIRKEYADECIVALRDYFFDMMQPGHPCLTRFAASLSDYGDNAYRSTLHYFHSFDIRTMPYSDEVENISSYTMARDFWRHSGIDYTAVTGNRAMMKQHRMQAPGAPFLYFDHVILEVAEFRDGDVYSAA